MLNIRKTLFLILVFGLGALTACSPAGSQATTTRESPTAAPASETPTARATATPTETDARPTPALIVAPEQQETYQPQPEDAKLERAPANATGGEGAIIDQALLPKVYFNLQGTLPTPCHQLRVAASEPDADGRIRLDVYSVVDPDQMCIQVIEEFEANVLLGEFASGTYTVVVNDQAIGEFTVP